MKKLWWVLPVLIFAFIACADKTVEEDVLPEEDILSEVPEGAQAVSLRGEPLYASTPYENVQEQYEEAKKVYATDPDSADNIIWYGRRAAYTGDYRGSIRIFTEGKGRGINRSLLKS